MVRKIILVELVVFLSSLVGFNLRRRLTNQEPFGAYPITPLLFHLGKLSMGLSWAFLFVHAVGRNVNLFRVSPFLDILSAVLIAGALVLTVLAFLYLGDASRFGLPGDAIEVRTTGVYSVSRNPMYLGFYLVTLASLLSVPHPPNIMAAVLGVFVHHRIVLAEERFLLKSCGRSYETYMVRVPRYL